MSEIQLTSAHGFNVNNIIFSKPQAAGGPKESSSVKFRRIYISTKYQNGGSGDLILSTPRVFSFGLSENISLDDKNKSNGFVFPLVLLNKDGASAEELEFVETLTNVVNHVKKYILTNKKDLKLPLLDESDLKKFNPIFYKKDKETGDIASDAIPTLYLKVAISKKDGVEKIISNFYDKKTEKEINALDLLKKYCWATAAVKIESIFIGSKISLQLKLYEADVELVNTGKKRLLPRKQAQISVDVDDATDTKSDTGGENNIDDNEEVSSIISDIDENTITEPEPEPEPVKTVKKIVKVVKKKKGE